MESKEYTPIEIIDITIGNLSNINVPAGLTEQIGIPMMQNINNLKILKKKLEEPVEASEEIINLGTVDLEGE